MVPFALQGGRQRRRQALQPSGDLADQIVQRALPGARRALAGRGDRAHISAYRDSSAAIAPAFWPSTLVDVSRASAARLAAIAGGGTIEERVLRISCLRG